MEQEIKTGQFEAGNPLRSPTLTTVRMVEKTIQQHSGELGKTQLWHRLPRKVMWNTYLTVLAYLEELNKIVISGDGTITYIWDPEGASEYLIKGSEHTNGRMG